jgi:hypothetical protein
LEAVSGSVARPSEQQFIRSLVATRSAVGIWFNLCEWRKGSLVPPFAILR